MTCLPVVFRSHPIAIVGLLIASVTLTQVLAIANAPARPFQNGDLFVGHSIKQSSADRRFRLGANLQIAPIRALIKRHVDEAIDKIAGDHPEIKQVSGYLKDVDTEQLRALANAKEKDLAMFKEEFKKQMGDQLTAEQKSAIDSIDKDKLEFVAEVLDVMNEPEDMVTFSLEPYAELNLDYFRATGLVALAGFNSAKRGTGVEIGNLGVDLATGDSYGDPGFAFGWSLGVTAYAPTGTENSNLIALSNILAAPRYFREYASAMPHLEVGLDLSFLQLTARTQYVHMIPARDDSLSEMSYLHSGIGVLGYFKVMGLSLEIDGLFNINNAVAMDQVFLATAGVRFYFGFLHLGAAIQTTLAQPDSPDRGMNIGGVGTGKMADYNFLLTAQFNFTADKPRKPRPPLKSDYEPFPPPAIQPQKKPTPPSDSDAAPESSPTPVAPSSPTPPPSPVAPPSDNDKI